MVFYLVSFAFYIYHVFILRHFALFKTQLQIIIIIIIITSASCQAMQRQNLEVVRPSETTSWSGFSDLTTNKHTHMVN